MYELYVDCLMECPHDDRAPMMNLIAYSVGRRKPDNSEACIKCCYRCVLFDASTKANLL